MSNRKFSRVIQAFLSKIGKSFQAIPKSLVNWLLRTALATTRRTQSAAGFILPTTVLLVLVVALTVGALSYRAFTRNTSVIADSQQRVIYNAATPTTDRARSKLEFLFDASKDTRYPGGVPSESRLLAMLLEDGSNGVTALSSTDVIYTLPDEKRVDINNDGKNDNAWSYRTDTNGDGKEDATVIYSVIFKAPPANGASSTQQELIKLPERDKANAQLVRQGPLTQENSTIRCASSSGRITTEDGWFQEPSNTSILRKNFQVDAFVLPDDPKSVATTIEFNQDRQLDRGNKWGAWFRNDLEIFPGPQFNWNGAMHTEGSLILGGTSVRAYLISSKNSCLFYESASQISTTQKKTKGSTTIDFLGHVYAGKVGDDDNAGSATIDVQDGNSKNYASVTLNNGKSSSTEGKPSAILIDPKPILVGDQYSSRGSDKTNTKASTWTSLGRLADSNFKNRFLSESQPAPYVDDLYRADNRWGPKPRYNSSIAINSTDKIGDPIKSFPALDALVPATGQADSAVGLDGYWERRARNEGLRILVGQRLELGNLNTWITPRDVNGDTYIDPGSGPIDPTKDEREGDPLYPPTVPPYPVSKSTEVVKHLDLQRRTLRDNLAAVQSMAVYHQAASTGKDFPVACVASTSHPGTVTTLRQSINFFPTLFKDGLTTTNVTDASGNVGLLTDFFTGRGTNGWEFAPPAASDAAFKAKIANGTPLRLALTNLANFAGDPEGAYPFDFTSKTNGTKIRPYPALTMWGNYSNLRRTLADLDSGVDYDNLSPADKTYLHTAACTLGMLAYEIDTIQKFNPSNQANEDLPGGGALGLMTSLAEEVMKLMDGAIDPTASQQNFEVLPKAQLSTYNYDPSLPDNKSVAKYNPRDYYGVPPEVFIGKLREQLGGNDPRVRMAELIMLHYQIKRDRTYGFRPSPAWGEYASDRAGLKVDTQTFPRVFPSACNPDDFFLKDGGESLSGPQVTGTDPGFISTKLAQRRLALSRLCGALNVDNYAPGNLPGSFTQQVTPDAPALATMPTVLPKFPALYYLFPQIEHTVDGKFEPNAIPDPKIIIANLPGEYDHRQPGNDDFEPADKKASPLVPKSSNKAPVDKVPPEVQGPAPGLKLADVEPYVKDSYIRTTAPKLGAGSPFQKVSSVVVKPGLNTLGIPNLKPLDLTKPNSDPTIPSAYPNQNRTTVYNVPDYSVSQIALTPRKSDLSDWQLPTGTLAANQSAATISGGPNIAPNYIMAPTGATTGTLTTPVSVPFLERAFMDGRQLMTVRTTDIDLGLLRSSKKSLTNDAWLPKGGIVYAFREDAVREDAILRPAAAGGLDNVGTNLTNLANPTDPTLTLSATNRGVTLKPIDYLPDPERRPYGFRLRNGSQIKRNDSTGIAAKENNRGLSFFSDQPVYIQGDFNLHQNGADDTAGTRLEEFDVLLKDDFSADEFYKRGNGSDGGKGDPRFANADPSITDANKKDRWRPAEILSDAISILSNDFCDGAIADSFVTTQPTSRPDFSTTGDPNNGINRVDYGGINVNAEVVNDKGLFGPGCNGSGYTSFQNQTRPKDALDTGKREEWVREVGYNYTLPQRDKDDLTSYWGDYTAPIKLDRTGDPLVATANPPGAAPKQQLNRPLPYGLSPTRIYCGPGDDDTCRKPSTPASTRINSIIVSGITPSRQDQSYGGLHNFPRFLEDWNNTIKLFINGSFLQLSFNNYATGPFEQEGLEPGEGAKASQQNIKQYQPPLRIWGYDVGLQFSPAGPAASRFVTASSTRNEFYTEPEVSDPYINNLCVALRDKVVSSSQKPQVNCPG